MWEIIIGFFIGVVITYILLRHKKSPPIDNKEVEKLKNSLVALQYEKDSLLKDVGGIEAVLGSKEKELDQLGIEKQKLSDLLSQEAEKNKVILSQKKSSEIRTGHIAETLAPFLLKGHDPKKLKWLGQPIDYIAFDDDGVTFIEIKTGRSHLSFNQKLVKQLVLDKKVYWQEFRLRGFRRNKHDKNS
jgi:predicted Holliday junction resolvase-like endonuclease